MERRGDTLVVRLPEQLVAQNRQELKAAMLEELERGERKFLVDFGRTGYVDSSGLGVLVSLSKKIREQGGELALTNLNDDLKTLFKLTKLDTLFSLRDDWDEGDGGAGRAASLPPRSSGPLRGSARPESDDRPLA